MRITGTGTGSTQAEAEANAKSNLADQVLAHELFKGFLFTLGSSLWLGVVIFKQLVMRPLAAGLILLVLYFTLWPFIVRMYDGIFTSHPFAVGLGLLFGVVFLGVVMPKIPPLFDRSCEGLEKLERATFVILPSWIRIPLNVLIAFAPSIYFVALWAIFGLSAISASLDPFIPFSQTYWFVGGWMWLLVLPVMQIVSFGHRSELEQERKDYNWCGVLYETDVPPANGEILEGVAQAEADLMEDPATLDVRRG